MIWVLGAGITVLVVAGVLLYPGLKEHNRPELQVWFLRAMMAA